MQARRQNMSLLDSAQELIYGKPEVIDAIEIFTQDRISYHHHTEQSLHIGWEGRHMYDDQLHAQGWPCRQHTEGNAK